MDAGKQPPVSVDDFLAPSRPAHAQQGASLRFVLRSF
jgi:hypothetical protein